jgi:hypothetical protein
MASLVAIWARWGQRRYGFRAEALQSGQDALGLGQDGDWVRLEAGAWSLPGFELALEDERRERQFGFWEGEVGGEKDFSRPAPGESHEAESNTSVTL